MLLVKDAQMAEFASLGATQTLAHGDWVDHKTGTLPRQLNLAKGTEPLERMSLIRVTPSP